MKHQCDAFVVNTVNMRDYSCANMYTQIAYGHHGQSVAPCCMFKGKARLPTVDEIDPLNHETFRAMRDLGRSGIRIPECEFCWQLEDAGVQSDRQYRNAKNPNLNDVILNRLDWFMGNLCNFTCIMCSSHQSYKLKAIEEKLGIHRQTRLVDNDFGDLPYDISSLRWIRFIGGEPFLQQDKMIDALTKIRDAQNGLDELYVTVNTNGSSLPHSDLLSMFHQCIGGDIAISIDGVGMCNDYQRTGAEWHVLLENIRDLRAALQPHWTISLCPTWSIINAPHVIDYCQWVADTFPEMTIGGQLVNQPSWYACQNLPRLYKEMLIDNINDTISNTQRVDFLRTLKLVRSALLLPASISLAEMVRHLDAHDAVRNQSFRSIFPELWQHISYEMATS